MASRNVSKGIQMGASAKVAVMTQVQLVQFEIEFNFSDRMEL
jgi:hypothetical protein